MHPFTEYEDKELEAVKVEVVSSVSERTSRPEFGEGTTFPFSGTTIDQMVQLIPQEPRRHRAVIIVTAGAAAASVFIGSASKVANGQGMKLTAPINSSVPFVSESQSAVYAISDKVAPSTVSVWDERYQ